MVPLNLEQLGAAYYTGNCHKWLCAPKGAGFLHVRSDRQKTIRPLSISHGANSPRTDRSRFLIEFDWTGTWDPSAYLTVPEAIRFMSALLPGGWPAIMQRNRQLAIAARNRLCDALHLPPPCPEELLGSLASVPIADARDRAPPASPLYADPLQDWLKTACQIEVPVIPWPAPPKRLLRISAQLYNALPQYDVLARAMQQSTKPVSGSGNDPSLEISHRSTAATEVGGTSSRESLIFGPRACLRRALSALLRGRQGTRPSDKDSVR